MEVINYQPVNMNWHLFQYHGGHYLVEDCGRVKGIYNKVKNMLLNGKDEIIR